MSGLSGLYYAIGATVTQWAFIEQSLDLCVAAIGTIPGGKTLTAKRGVPVSLSLKCDVLGMALKRLPELKPHKDAGLALIARVTALKDRRHELVHSALADPQPVGGVYTFISLKGGGTLHEASAWQFDLNSFSDLEQTTQALVDDLHRFAVDLWVAQKARLGPPLP